MELIAVWSIDPNETGLAPTPSDLDALRDYHVIPVSVLPTKNTSDLEKVNSYLKKFLVANNLEAPTILTTHPRQTAVEQVITFANERHASVIALTSHGRYGLERMFLGSFAEKLLDHSKIPVLFLTSRSKHESSSHRAIFTTDFSPKSKAIFKDFINFAKHSVNEIILFHAMQIPIEVLSAYALAGAPIFFPDSALDDEYTAEEAEALFWVKEFSTPELKIILHPIVRDNFNSVSREVLETCKNEHISLIGVTTEEEFAKELFRKQTQPVWVYNSRTN